MVVKAEEPSGGEGEVEVVGTASGGVKMWELWMVLLARLVTRGKDEERVEDPLSVLEMRKALSNFVVDDFTTRFVSLFSFAKEKKNRMAGLMEGRLKIDQSLLPFG